MAGFVRRPLIPALSADVYSIYLPEWDRLWSARGGRFFQILGINSSSFLEFIPVFWNFGLVWGYVRCGCVKCRFFVCFDTTSACGCVRCRFFAQIDTITPAAVSNAAK